MNDQTKQSENMSLYEIKKDLIDTGHWVDQKGWCPATGGNFSVRLNDPEGEEDRCLVTASGSHKGHLDQDKFIITDLYGTPVDPTATNRPSAETLVHVALYRLSADINAVLHIHSVPNTVLSQQETADYLVFNGLEMQKSLSGIHSHEEVVKLALFDNTQNMQTLADQVQRVWLEQSGLTAGLLVRGHGAYFWGHTLSEAKRHLEGIEFMLACMLEFKKLT